MFLHVYLTLKGQHTHARHTHARVVVVCEYLRNVLSMGEERETREMKERIYTVSTNVGIKSTTHD